MPPKVPTWLNPKNWGVDDYSSEKSFNSAFAKAKSSNQEEFLYNGKRFNTKSNLSAKEQIKRYGINDDQRLSPSGPMGKLRTNLADNLHPFSYGTSEDAGTLAPYKRALGAAVGIKDPARTTLDTNPDVTNSEKERVDYNNLYFGQPQKYNTLAASDHRPKTSKDPNAVYYTSQTIKNSLAQLKEDYNNPDRQSDSWIAELREKGKTGTISGFDSNTGNYTVGKGSDDKGEYISLYDNWDLAPIGDGADESRGIGKPYDIYDKIYLTDKQTAPTNMNKTKVEKYLKGGVAPKMAKGGKVKAPKNIVSDWQNANGIKPPVTGSTNPGVDFSNVLSSTAPFLDNIANLVTTSKTPNIPNPVLNQSPRLTTRINTGAQTRQIEDDVTAANRGINMSTSSAGVANANKGSVLANKWRALGNVEANRQNTEVGLQNQQAYANAQTQAGNNSLINQRNFNQMQRTDDINQRYGEVLSDVGSDIGNINRERNMVARDREAMKILSKINPDTAYQFADTKSFQDLYAKDEKGLRDLITKTQGEVPQSKLKALYKKLFNKNI